MEVEVMHAATNATVIITPIITMYVELLANTEYAYPSHL